MVDRRGIVFPAGLIGVATLAAYHHALTAPFLADDSGSILDNPSIRQLWPLTGPLFPTAADGEMVSGRPILNLSLALNHALSGVQPWSYHVLNVLIHLAAGLVLFGLVRRVLPRVAGGRGFATPPVLPKGPDRVIPPYHLKVFATPVACVVALGWALHPLQTGAVTPVMQRAESLMGLFYLLTVYGFVRMAGAGGGWRWGLFSVTMGLLAMGTNAAALTAPLFVLLADRVFFCDGVWAALQRRPGYYFALAATWVPAAWLMVGAGGESAPLSRWRGADVLSYWLTQPEALTRYLGLAVWPHPLIFDYGDATHPSRLVLIGCALVVASLVALAVWMWIRRRPEVLGLGAFLLLLAPTSLVPGEQIIAEHRMYLPLAGMAAVFVAATTAWLGRRGLVCCLALALAGGWATAARNRDYQDAFRLWSDTVEKRPGNARAHEQVGLVLLERGEISGAVPHLARAVSLAPGLASARFHLGDAFLRLNRVSEARAQFAEALRLQPDYAPAQEALSRLERGEPR